MLYVVTAPDPPPGADFTLIVPGNYLYDVVGITAKLTTGLGNPILHDSSGFGNDGTYLTGGTGTITFDHAPGLVAGDTDIICNPAIPTLVGGSGPTTSGWLNAGSFWIVAWCDGTTNQPQNMVILRVGAGGDVGAQLGVTNGFLGNPTVFFDFNNSAIGLDYFGAVAAGPHMYAATYDAVTDEARIYIDGVRVLGPTVVGGAPVFDANWFDLGAAPGNNPEYDEIAWGSGLPDDAAIANLYAQATVSFAAYTAAQLALAPFPFGYYHLDDVVTAGGRQPSLVISNGTTELEAIPTGFPAVATPGPYEYSWQPGLNADTQSTDGTLTTVAVPPLVLPAGYTVGTRTLDILPADQWSNVTLWWDDNAQRSIDPAYDYNYPPGALLRWRPLRLTV